MPQAQTTQQRTDGAGMERRDGPKTRTPRVEGWRYVNVTRSDDSASKPAASSMRFTAGNGASSGEYVTSSQSQKIGRLLTLQPLTFLWWHRSDRISIEVEGMHRAEGPVVKAVYVADHEEDE